MALVKGYAYDANTGKGEFTYTGYIPADKGFKVVATPGAWDDQWGNADSEGFTNLVNDKNSQNIKVNAAGWYTLHLNTLENKLTMKATTFETQPTEYDAVTLIYGSESVNMTKVTSGDKTWGGEVFPFGSFVDGATISCKPGDYTVLFNELDECYYFKAK